MAPMRTLQAVLTILAGSAIGLGGVLESVAQGPPAGATGPKYRFYETYTTEPTPAPGAIGQSRVAFRETMTSSAETARGAQESRNLVVQAIYRERPVDVAPTDSRRVTAAVRHYDAVRVQPAPEALPSDRPALEGLEIWYEPVPNQAPQMLVLTPDRSMTDQESLYAARQVFVPDLAYALPDLPIAVGETYRVPRTGMATLLGGIVLDGALTGTLESVEDDASGGKVAVFDITGQGTIDGPRAASVHAQIRFPFAAGETEQTTPAGATAPVTTIDAPGHIARLSLAEQIALTPDAGRLRQGLRRELVLERRVDDPGDPLEVPAAMPEPTIENSWLVTVDPQGRFHVRHPQDLTLQPSEIPDTVEFFRPLPDGGDVVRISLLPDAQVDPEAVRRDLTAQWDAERLVIQPLGEPGFLPEADWPGRRVYRIEVLQMPPGSRPDTNAPQLYFSGYVLQTGRPTGFYAEGDTSRSEVESFRALTETILKTLAYGKPGQAGSPPARLPSLKPAPEQAAPPPDAVPEPAAPEPGSPIAPSTDIPTAPAPEP